MSYALGHGGNADPITEPDMTDTGFFTEALSSRDPELFKSITDELGRQPHEI